MRIFLFIAGFTLWMWGVNYPHVGIYNANNNYLTLAAKNYLRFGFDTLNLFPTYFAGEVLPSPIPYYLHHPILIFPLSTIPFMLFGFHNWVVHGVNFLFLIGVLFLLYTIGEFIWGRKVGLWTAGLAMIFPMTSFFWKYIFFEQGSLFFNLLVFYFFLKYIKAERVIFLAYIFLFTFLSGLIDWGVLYLFIPFLVFIFSKYKKPAVRAIIVYLAATVASLSIFVGGAYYLTHDLRNTIHAVSIRAAADELLSLPLWPVRLFFISIIRIGIYFTPFAFVAMWFFYKAIRAKKLLGLGALALLFSLIFGILNLLVLPTGSWGHSYFLFYLIPFFAFSGALWIVKHEKNRGLILSLVTAIIVSSTVVNYFKLLQVQKQLWKYGAATELNNFLDPYEPVGVVHFPGDVFEQYFLHPTHYMTEEDVYTWLSQKDSKPQKLVIACADVCDVGELSQLTTWSQGQTLVTYSMPPHTAWLLVKRTSVEIKAKLNTETDAKTEAHEGVILQLYRSIRDILGVVQI